MKQHPWITCAIIGATIFTAGRAVAGPAPVVASGKEAPPPPPKETDWCESVWGLTTLYKNEDNPFIQEFAITGRYHGQFWMLDSDPDSDEEDDWDHRRFRYGARAKLFHDFELKAEAFGDLNEHDWYSGFTDFHLAWKPSDAVNVVIGKQKPKFSLDWTTSSREMLTIERNIVINNFGIDYETGLSVSGKNGNWSYFAGVFNNDVRDSSSDEAEFGDLDGGWSYIANLAYDLKEYFSTDKAVVRLDYIHMEHDGQDDFLTRFDDAVALSLNVKQGKFGIITEGIYADGDDGEIYGVYVMPTYDITKKLQVVARYTYGHSSDDALRLQSRYEREADVSDSGFGEEYNAGYLGLNYYICSHKLKLMTGLEYSDMDGGDDGGDFEGWTWTSGVRVYW